MPMVLAFVHFFFIEKKKKKMMNVLRVILHISFCLSFFCSCKNCKYCCYLTIMISFATVMFLHWFWLTCLLQEWDETVGGVSLLDTLFMALDEVNFL